MAPYEVKQTNIDIDIPTPGVDGFITEMQTDIVDANGSQVPINRLMLHHIVFLNLGSKFGAKRDGTCNRFTALDSKTALPNIGERFGGSGEERLRMRLPAGYGYPIKAKDRWGMSYMLMNHRNKTDSAYVQYTVTYDTAPKKPAKPYWLDIKNCLSDPVFDIPGGKKRGSTTRRSRTWTVPETGRVVAGGGHVHGGARSMTLNRAGCELYRSKPTWGRRGHPFYRVKPVLHEPGPVNMSAFTSAEGFPVQRGEQLRLDANYDGEILHTRVMGIMVIWFAPDATAKPTKTCTTPADLREYRGEAGRAKPPRFTRPAHRPDRQRQGAQDQGAARQAGEGEERLGDRSRRPLLHAPQRVGQVGLHAQVALLRRGASQRDRGQRSARLLLGEPERQPQVPHRSSKTPGTYRLFCGLHPVAMTQTVKVLPKRKRK